MVAFGRAGATVAVPARRDRPAWRPSSARTSISPDPTPGRSLALRGYEGVVLEAAPRRAR